MGNFFRKVWLFLVTVSRGLNQFVRENVGPAIEVVEAVKYVVNHPGADFLVELTNTNVDNAVLEFVQKHINKVLQGLVIVERCEQQSTIQGKIECYVEALRKLDPELRHAVYAKLASRIARLTAVKQVSESDADMLTQLKYSLEKKGR